jgi:superoxide dismutase, Fe-Mn family
VISARTISFHYGKHHRTYVETVNKLIAGTPYADLPLNEIVKKSAGETDRALFNNSAQAWNHTFYWNSLAPNAGGAPGAQLSAMINDAFGSYDAFAEQFVKSATGQFGSGWVWLTQDRATKKLALVKTANADTPITGETHAPLAVLDVWEHAYYLDYQNRRKDHAGEVIAKLLNWRFVEKNLEKA